MPLRKQTLALCGAALSCLFVTGALAESLGERFVYRYLLPDAVKDRVIPKTDQTPKSTTYSGRLITLASIDLGADLVGLGFPVETQFALAGNGNGGGILGGGPMLTWPDHTMKTFCQYVYQLQGGPFECFAGLTGNGVNPATGKSTAGVVITAPGAGIISVVSSVFGDNIEVNPERLFGSNQTQIIVSNTY